MAKLDKITVNVSCNCENFKEIKKEIECNNNPNYICNRIPGAICLNDPSVCGFSKPNKEEPVKDKASEAVQEIKKLVGNIGFASVELCIIGEELKAKDTELLKRADIINGQKQEIKLITGDRNGALTVLKQQREIIDQWNKETVEFKEEIKSLSVQLSWLNDCLEEKDEEISSLEEDVAVLSKDDNCDDFYAEALKRVIADKDILIRDLKGKLDKINGQKKETEIIDELKETINELKLENKLLYEKIQDQSHVISSRYQSIKELKTGIARLKNGIEIFGLDRQETMARFKLLENEIEELTKDKESLRITYCGVRAEGDNLKYENQELKNIMSKMQEFVKQDNNV